MHGRGCVAQARDPADRPQHDFDDSEPVAPQVEFSLRRDGETGPLRWIAADESHDVVEQFGSIGFNRNQRWPLASAARKLVQSAERSDSAGQIIDELAGVWMGEHGAGFGELRSTAATS